MVLILATLLGLHWWNKRVQEKCAIVAIVVGAQPEKQGCQKRRTQLASLVEDNNPCLVQQSDFWITCDAGALVGGFFIAIARQVLDCRKVAAFYALPDLLVEDFLG